MVTVSLFVSAFRHVAEAMALPRVLITPHLMGRPVGYPGDPDAQREVVHATLQLVTEAEGPATIVDVAPGGHT